MTDQQQAITRLITTATLIAGRAPLKQGTYVSKAGIPWRLIKDLRSNLEDLGVDWKAMR